MTLAHITLGDLGSLAALIALVGGQVVLVITAVRNKNRIIEVHERVKTVEDALKPPSGGTIASQIEGISQAFHLLAQLYEEREHRTHRNKDVDLR